MAARASDQAWRSLLIRSMYSASPTVLPFLPLASGELLAWVHHGNVCCFKVNEVVTAVAEGEEKWACHVGGIFVLEGAVAGDGLLRDHLVISVAILRGPHACTPEGQ
jgi:hypothetical protein